MDQFLKELTKAGDLTSVFSPLDIALVLSLSFILSLVITWIYRYTHKGVSYSQSFAQTLPIMGTVVGMIMLIIGLMIQRKNRGESYTIRLLKTIGLMKKNY